MSKTPLTPEKYRQEFDELVRNCQHDSDLMRGWLEVFHSNILSDHGYDQKPYTELYLSQGWGKKDDPPPLSIHVTDRTSGKGKMGGG